MIHSRETEYLSKMASNWRTPIWYKSWSHRFYRNVSNFESQRSLLFLPREISWADLVTKLLRPSHPPGSSIHTFIFPDHSLLQTASDHTPARRPLSAGGTNQTRIIRYKNLLPAQEASFNRIVALNDQRYGDRMQQFFF